MRRQCSVSAPSTGPRSMTPALLISPSSPPSCSCAPRTKAWALSSSPTSARSATARPPSDSIRSRSSSSRSSRRAPSATAAPSRAKAAAQGAPMPEDAPVVAIRRPWSDPATLGRAPFGQLDQRPYAEARGALAHVGPAEAPRRPGDVHVHPRLVVDELAQELGGVARHRLALIGGVGQVGVLALGQLEDLRVERHAPPQLAGHLACGRDLRVPVVVVREQAGVG